MDLVHPQACGKCGRAIHDDRVSCLYCGWSTAAEFDESAPLRPAGSEPSEPRTFRPGATTGSLILWSIVASVAAALLFRRLPAPASLLAPAALVIVGPLALGAHLLRMALVSVTVLPGEGLLLSGRRRIAWPDIDRVEYKGARFVSDFALVRLLLDLVRSISGLVVGGVHGPIRLLLMLLMVALSLLIPPAAFVSGVFFPVFFLLSPWQPRIVLMLKSGERVAYRDLRHEGNFVAMVQRGLRQGELQGEPPEGTIPAAS